MFTIHKDYSCLITGLCIQPKICLHSLNHLAQFLESLFILNNGFSLKNIADIAQSRRFNTLSNCTNNITHTARSSSFFDPNSESEEINQCALYVLLR